MGTFTGFEQFMAGMSAVNLAQGLASSAAASSHAQAQASAQAQAMQAAAERQRRALDQQYGAETRKRENLLERATARARVSFGARGIAPGDGSAGALLQGIEDGFAADEADRAENYAMQRESLDAGLSDSLQRVEAGRQRNLLAGEDDIQRRILGLLRWGGATFGRGGSGGGTRMPQGDFPPPYQTDSYLV